MPKRTIAKGWTRDIHGRPAPFTPKQFEDRCDQICGCAGKHDCKCISVFTQASAELWGEANERKDAA